MSRKLSKQEWVFIIVVVSFSLRGIDSAVSRQGQLSKHPVLLVVSFDGFRYDYMDKTSTPILKSIQNEGISVPFMQAQFPTKTFPNHQSIATGLFAPWHGITDNVVYDPLHSKTLSGFDDDPGFWNFHDDAIPFWIRNEQAGDNRYSACYMWAGSSQGYGKDSQLFPTYYIPKYNSSVPWESRVETVLEWIMDPIKPANMIFLYHNEPDSQGHSSGTDDEETYTEIRRVDNRTAHLVNELKNAGIYDKINLIILSDHGMQTVPRENVINTESFADRALFDIHGGTPLYHIKPHNPTNTESIYESFKSASTGKHFSVYKKDELSFLNYGDNRRIMDVVLLADPGFGFEDLNSRFNDKGVTGIHGYDHRSPNMTAIFIARGPIFKKGFKTEHSFNNVDLFPLFSKIMSVPISPNNGSLEIVASFLEDVRGIANNLVLNPLYVLLIISYQFSLYLM